MNELSFVRMNKMSVEAGISDVIVKRVAPPPPPPSPPSFLKKTTATASVTNQEIAKFWRQKRMVEEDHLLAAIKAAARIRTRKLTDEDCKFFEELSKEDSDKEVEDATINNSKVDENGKELRVGIKDWWTKSKYAYLNQPAIGATDKPKRRPSTYIPNFCNYKPRLPPTVSFGIF